MTSEVSETQAEIKSQSSSQPPQELKDLADLVSLCKRRGFIFPSSEVYGGINACWDYGPLGIELKRNIKDRWWKAMTDREDVEGLDAAILMHPRVWEASGHVAGLSIHWLIVKNARLGFELTKLTPRHWLKKSVRTAKEN
jgi:glycyl-tRNA synthetase